MTNVRTRFAPSPTGYMHIGGMRTALFNWLWARHSGGTFVLRIDDTDRERNLEAALQPIFQAFRWLELDWDEGPEVGGPLGPYFQSERTEWYQQAAERLLAEGKAFRDFDPPDQVQADRQAAEHEKRSYVNIRRSLDLSAGQIEQFLAEGRPHVLRLLVPRDQTVAVNDAVRGPVEWDCALMPDPVLARSDGSPLYNFASAVDDAQMQITHVIRAEEHLSNTPIQVLIHQALANPIPQFAHIPFITAPGSNKKLSKRDAKKLRGNPQLKKLFDRADAVFPQIGLGDSETLNPLMVEYYQRIGYLPHAVLNTLARFGWSLDDKTEIMTRQTIIESFTLDRVVKSPAGFDADKLDSIQTHWMNQLPVPDKVTGCVPYLAKAGLIGPSPDEGTLQFLAELTVALGDRLKIFTDILDYADFFTADDQLPYDEKAFEKRIRKKGGADLLSQFRGRLAGVEPFDAETVEAAMRDFVESEEIKIGQIIHAVRVAVTGKPTGPGLFDCLVLLGRDRCLARIDRALSRV